MLIMRNNTPFCLIFPYSLMDTVAQLLEKYGYTADSYIPEYEWFNDNGRLNRKMEAQPKKIRLYNVQLDAASSFTNQGNFGKLCEELNRLDARIVIKTDIKIDTLR